MLVLKYFLQYSDLQPLDFCVQMLMYERRRICGTVKCLVNRLELSGNYMCHLI
jgi:hypothetical protein